jgi:hypothetical protein
MHFIDCCYVDKNNIRSVASMGKDPAVSKAAQLFRYDCMLSIEDLHSNKVNRLILFLSPLITRT